MTTIAYVLILIGAVAFGNLARGRRIQDLPGDLGDAFAAIASTDTARLRQVLSRRGEDIVTAQAAVTPVTGDASRYNLGPVTPQLSALVAEVAPKFGVTSVGGYRASDPYPDHPSGHAADFMVGSDKAKGDAIAEYLIANAARLNVKYLIWYQRSWNPSRGTWAGMEDRGSATQNHRDHVHVTVN